MIVKPMMEFTLTGLRMRKKYELDLPSAQVMHKQQEKTQSH